MSNERTKWKRGGTRYFYIDCEKFNAVIFGSPSPRSLWAWAVWSRGRTDEGVEWGLRSARRKARAIIEIVSESSALSEVKR